jgi:hypothetical protein
LFGARLSEFGEIAVCVHGCVQEGLRSYRH